MTDNRKIICEKRTYSRELNSHDHDFGQLLFPLYGSMHIQTMEQNINLTSDYCFYLPPELNHAYRSNDRNEFLILDIPKYYLPSETQSMYIQLERQWSSIRYLLLEETINRNKASNALRDLTSYIAQKLPSATSPSIDYIQKHYKEPIKLEKLAKLEHYHPVYFSSWFKQKTGKSPKTYISELRLDEAKRLLHSTTWSITSISEELGFKNSSSFTRWFVKYVGSPPQKYRNLK
ncbi:helix-turn-helix domain-containing protein [Pseudogracilibacillus auburnensis]|uniref:helix-turn-helix domain-containing protein n=1 Tax=Pseudogracilibacillus auburnensis TaxID=1494959 RepID=UPI001A964E21|nr:AraC family transcriptional regulator [Pseudogracilibacillus auburnensis]MBO1001117.1 helix-turn-helix domain-containing protein [Pseudogracilibacillus auburnensis]